MLRLIAIALLLVTTQSCLAKTQEGQFVPAESHPSFWLTGGFLSHHFYIDKEDPPREHNSGLGFQAHLTPAYALNIGYYENSFWRRSNYFGIIWTPLKVDAFKFGLAISAIDGYPGVNHGDWSLYAIPMVDFTYKRIGFDLLLSPKVFALQFKFRMD